MKICKILLSSYSSSPFPVACEKGWIVVLRRKDGSVDFHRNWNTYKKGFGEEDGEYFIGLDKLNALTETRSMELLFVLEDKEGLLAYERYEMKRKNTFFIHWAQPTDQQEILFDHTMA